MFYKFNTKIMNRGKNSKQILTIMLRKKKNLPRTFITMVAPGDALEAEPYKNSDSHLSGHLTVTADGNIHHRVEQSFYQFLKANGQN